MSKAKELLEGFSEIREESKINEDRFNDQLDKNTGADSKVVSAVDKVANSGHWLDRYIGIAKAIKHSSAKHLVSLKAIVKDEGSPPQGLGQLADELAGGVFFDMVMKLNWTRDQLKVAVWGLPLDQLEMYGLADLRSKK